MGQSVAVVENPTSRPGIVRFELNRSLSGMGHERYASAADAIDDRPVDELARRLFATEKVAGVHVYSNQVTVELAPFCTPEGLIDVVRGLFTHYVEGVEPKKFETA